MPRQIPNDFTSFELTPDEELIGSSFSDLQEMYLRNELSVIAVMKLELEQNDPNHGYLKGKIDAIRGLLVRSSDNRQEAMQRMIDAKDG